MSRKGRASLCSLISGSPRLSIQIASALSECCSAVLLEIHVEAMHNIIHASRTQCLCCSYVPVQKEAIKNAVTKKERHTP